MRRLLLFVTLFASCAKRDPSTYSEVDAGSPPATPAPPTPPAPPIQPPAPPGETWSGDGARVALASARVDGNTLYVGVSMEAMSRDRLVDLRRWRIAAPTAIDSKGNSLHLQIPPTGVTTGTLRFGNPAAVVFAFDAPVESAAWVDVSFGPVRLRVPRKK
jgi:hypothetical protein